MIRGSCLCQGVTFEIDGKYSDIGHCHCSKCRKVSGANSNECGSPLPMCGENGKLYWVPVGVLDDDPGVPVAQHIFVASKGSWEVIGDEAPQYPEDAPTREAS